MRDSLRTNRGGWRFLAEIRPTCAPPRGAREPLTLLRNTLLAFTSQREWQHPRARRLRIKRRLMRVQNATSRGSRAITSAKHLKKRHFSVAASEKSLAKACACAIFRADSLYADTVAPRFTLTRLYSTRTARCRKTLA